DSPQVRKISATGAIATVGDTADGAVGWPSALAIDRAGALYIADATKHRVVMLAPGAHAVTTVAGGSLRLGDHGPATSANLRRPTGLALDAMGNLYIADCESRRVRKASSGPGIITTVAGGHSQARNESAALRI